MTPSPRVARRLADMLLQASEERVGYTNSRRAICRWRKLVKDEAETGGRHTYMVTNWKMRFAVLEAIADGIAVISDEPAGVSWLDQKTHRKVVLQNQKDLI